MKKHGNSKYRPKFAKDLRNGLRKDGWTIQECCRHWKVTKTAYDGWIKTYAPFAHAHELGEQDYQCWWAERYRNTATGIEPGNAAMMNLAAKNILGFVDKQEVHNTHEEAITTLRIEVYKPNGILLDGRESNNIIDAEPI